MALSGDLQTLLLTDLPEGRQSLMESHVNLERVAEYCESNFFQAENKRSALEMTKGYTTQSLASVAYQINTLAYNFLQMLDLQSAQLAEMNSQVNHISQTVAIHKEKVARREIGVITTNKASNRQFKVIAPSSGERAVKYVRRPIDFSIFDDIGHGVKVQQQPSVLSSSSSSSMTTPRSKRPSNASQYSTTSSPYGSPAPPNTKPPTPPNLRYSVSSTGSNRDNYGTLSRASKEYRTPPLVAQTPKLPSNYAANYGTRNVGGPQVQLVHPVLQQHEMKGSSTTMPRLSSQSMRSTASTGSSITSGTLGRHSGLLHLQQQQQQQQQKQQQLLVLPTGSGQRPQSATTLSGAQYGTLTRPVQRPPSPPLPPPPQAAGGTNDNFNPVYSRSISQTSTVSNTSGSLAQQQLQQQLQQHLLLKQQQQQHQSQQKQQEQQQQQHLPQQQTMELNYGRQAPLLPSWVPKSYMERVSAIYDYTADKEDELTFTEGAIIYVLKKNDDGWWEGVMDGITGLFPGNYVETIDQK